MPDQFVNNDVGLGSPCRASVVADFSSSDFDFTAHAAGPPRALRVIGAGTLRYRLLSDGSDRAITFAAGYRDLPDRAAIIRQTTSSTLTVWGLY